MSIYTLRENPEWLLPAAQWFHSKWGVPTEAYLECMEDYLSNETEYYGAGGWGTGHDKDVYP